MKHTAQIPSVRGNSWRVCIVFAAPLTLALALTAMVLGSAAAQTYTITDVSAPDGNPSFATGVNAGGQVSGYSQDGAGNGQAWRFTTGTGSVNLGSFGGADSRATGINDAGTVTG